MITELTKEQEKLMDVVRDEWLEIGLSTEQSTREQMKAAVDECYRCAGLALPEYYYFLDSPRAGAVAVALLKQQNPEDRDTVKPPPADELIQKVQDLLKKDKLPRDIAKFAKESFDWVCYGQHDAGWLSEHDYYRRASPDLEARDGLSGFFAAARHCGWWWPMDNIAVVTAKTAETYFDADGKLHRDDGPACVYLDGWGTYCWHGVDVGKQAILQPETITNETIEAVLTAAKKKAAQKRTTAEQEAVAMAPSSREEHLKKAEDKIEEVLKKANDKAAALRDRRAVWDEASHG